MPSSDSIPSSKVTKGYLLLYWFLTYYSFGTDADLGIFLPDMVGLAGTEDYLEAPFLGGNYFLLLSGFMPEPFDLNEETEFYRSNRLTLFI